MAHIIEDGTGVALANAYIGLAEASVYHSTRNNAAWAAATESQQDAAIVAATDYIDRRFGARFQGRKQFVGTAFPAVGHLFVAQNAQNNSTVTIGSTVYTFVTVLALAYDVLIGADEAESASNLAAAINVSGTAGTEYGVGTLAHPDVEAIYENGGSSILVKVTSETGADSNGIALSSSTPTRLVWDLGETTGGTDSGEQYLEFPRLEVYSRAGTELTGIPLNLRKATCEYALRALSGSLAPDPTVDASGVSVVTTRKKIGPIEKEFQVLGSGYASIIRAYPLADALLLELLNPIGNRAIR
jgi:hypothetical protein